eukprot:scaffold105025_cov58-Phaeocystis_antarctica.AAC.4
MPERPDRVALEPERSRHSRHGTPSARRRGVEGILLPKSASNPAGVAPLPTVAKLVNDSCGRLCCPLSPL